MASDNSRRSGSAATATPDLQKISIKIDPGPYVGTVVSHITGNRLGQLQVYIPELSGINNGENPIISYCSPFYGKTFGTDDQVFPNTDASAGQSYGMWMVPPDVGNSVLVIFANGDYNRGFWIGCIYDSASHHMIPGMGRSIAGKNATTVPSGNLTKSVGSNSILPVTEYSLTSTAGQPNTQFNPDALTATPRPAHLYQTSVLLRQGLDRDPIRGAISSSSLRESPSNVYGISTPGRSGVKTPTVGNTTDRVVFRTGGHSFVMDDGAAGDSINAAGTDQLIRLRTAAGHQILMNDTENVLYVASSSGDCWLEFSAQGQIHMYSANGINMRTKGVMNFHADAAILMQSPFIKMNATATNPSVGGQTAIIMNTDGQFAATATQGASVATDGILSLSSVAMAQLKCDGVLTLSGAAMTSLWGGILKLNTGGPSPVLPISSSPVNTFTDSSLSPDSGTWQLTDKVNSVCTQVPTHEPWVDSDGKTRPGPQVPGQAKISMITGLATSLATGAIFSGLGSSLGSAFAGDLFG